VLRGLQLAIELGLREPERLERPHFLRDRARLSSSIACARVRALPSAPGFARRVDQSFTASLMNAPSR
jgi:hypothetical protein